MLSPSAQLLLDMIHADAELHAAFTARPQFLYAILASAAEANRMENLRQWLQQAQHCGVLEAARRAEWVH